MKSCRMLGKGSGNWIERSQSLPIGFPAASTTVRESRSEK